ncbi:hypothetical protein BC834DRAFT_975598 [Gloeopeniophorella convolvens]|nr:hypothetical protein BC834DRAFT_975598 [Gloeopeniophorella convolvens]
MFDYKPNFRYCYFCGGPLRDAYEDWKYRWLPEKWRSISEEENPECTGFYPEIEAESVDELDDFVCITGEDGRYWGDATVVSCLWRNTDFVCPVRLDFPYDGRFGIEIGGNSQWASEKNARPFLTIHRMCLSYICRRLKITPRELWRTIFPKPRPIWHTNEHKLIRYDGMDGRYDGYYFDYAARDYFRGKEEELYCYQIWTMERCAHLLAHPSVFPELEPVKPSQMHFSQPSQAQPPALFRVLSIGELFSHIISFLWSPSPDSPDDVRPVIHRSMLSTHTSLLRTCQGLYNLLSGRQDVYFGLVRDSGWMLPTTPADWAGWKAVGNPTPIRVGQLDWRAYLKAFVRPEENRHENRHIRNRWRLEKMAAQFGLPTPREYESLPAWSVGTYGRRSELTEPDLLAWEVPPAEGVEEGSGSGWFRGDEEDSESSSSEGSEEDSESDSAGSEGVEEDGESDSSE